MARIPDTDEELLRAARFQLGLDPPPGLEEAIQKTAHIPDEQLRPVLLKLVKDHVERKEPGTMAQRNAVVAHVLCTLHPQIPKLVMLRTMSSAQTAVASSAKRTNWTHRRSPQPS